MWYGARAALSGGLLVLACGLAAGCDRLAGRGMELVRRIEVPQDMRTVQVDSAGRFWLGGAGRLSLREASGRVLWRLALAPAEVPEVVGRAGGRTYVRADGRVLLVDAAEGRVRSERAGFDQSVLLLDARGPALYQGAASGAVLVHDPASLEPFWAWPSLGVPVTGLAASPEGDRIYLAVRSGARAGAVQVRDLQTGRVLSIETFPAPLRELTATPGGDLLGVMGAGERGAVVRLRPRGGQLALVWRSPAPPGEEQPPALRYSPATRRVAVFRPGTETGLRVFDVETGRFVGSVRETPLDAAFGPDGLLYLLYPGEVRAAREAR